ncbi:MAG: hypothetical protein QOI92_145 [Chloroflexota bacterium]|nr:hypothetical protein [Chloroflexota bacterium]
MDAPGKGPSQSVPLGIRVDCVIRRDHPSADHRVLAIGGRSRDGHPWRLSEEAAIAAIDNERAMFYVEWPQGHRLNVVVEQGLGRRYLKTEVDGELPDRLLALPDCD